jgi:probable phosphoglycerate mutase
MNDPHDALTHMVLVRHAETDWNRAGRMQGYLDSPLTALGEAQAQALAEALADEGIGHLYSSDQGRAVRTASVLAMRCGATLVTDERLRERHYGDLAGLTWQGLRAQHPELHARFAARDGDFVPPGGESLHQFRDRVLPALADIAGRHPGERVVVVTHGGVVGLVYRHALSIPIDAPRDYRLDNASINRFRCVHGHWQLQAWGDTAHLEGLGSRDELI